MLPSDSVGVFIRLPDLAWHIGLPKTAAVTFESSVYLLLIHFGTHCFVQGFCYLLLP